MCYLIPSYKIFPCVSGQLWRWDMLDNTFEEHPLYKLYCGDKAVVKIHSSNLRYL